MKGQWKGFVSGLAVATLVFGLGAPAFAATVRQLNASYSGIKITMDGKEIVPTDASGAVVEPFAVDGTIYLPVRAVANALGLGVQWEGATQTVKLSTPQMELDKKTIVYDDQYVTLSFVECRNKDDNFLVQSGGYEHYAEAVFHVVNKTDVELVIEPSAISFNGVSYKFGGMESVAPNSAGNVAFFIFNVELPTSGITKTTGTARIIDFSDTLFDHSYEVKWTDIQTQ